MSEIYGATGIISRRSDEIKLGEIREGHRITFPLPIPKKIVCNLCRPPISWKRQKSKHRDALKNVQDAHDNRVAMAFRCSTCGYCCTTLHAGNRHLARSCSYNNCDFVTHAAGVTVATSLDHHLARRHATQMGRRLWHCNGCNITMTGLETREHTCEGAKKRQTRGPPALADESTQPRRSVSSSRRPHRRGLEDQDTTVADAGQDQSTSSLPVTPVRSDLHSPEPEAPSYNTPPMLSPTEQELCYVNLSGDNEDRAFIKFGNRQLWGK
ncbi:hypothetical protein EGW08_017538 [Elysia chlorotica]|uniref:Uncharacterized protein n=1 Tax=Elysia chlorotica TaxID=188477 RepID=A0A433SZH7_ELYCH|nr:hypothetical protein EGW08_017538 [Elysia chlorotica]